MNPLPPEDLPPPPGDLPPPPEDLPGGLVLFPPQLPAAVRRRRLGLALLTLLAVLALSWPVYPLFSGIRPLILGLPLSLAWVVLWLGVVFAALVWAYRGEAANGSGV